MPNQQNNIITMQCGVIVTEKAGNPCIELRKATTDPDIIKNIINSAFYEQPIMMIPSFTNKLKALASLVDKGIIYMKEDKYYFVL